MKKIFAVAILSVLLIFGVALEKVSAQDVYVGSENGYDYYVQNESIFLNDDYTYAKALVKMVRNGQWLDSQTWEFKPIQNRRYGYRINETGRWHLITKAGLAMNVIDVVVYKNVHYR